MTTHQISSILEIFSVQNELILSCPWPTWLIDLCDLSDPWSTLIATHKGFYVQHPLYIPALSKSSRYFSSKPHRGFSAKYSFTPSYQSSCPLTETSVLVTVSNRIRDVSTFTLRSSSSLVLLNLSNSVSINFSTLKRVSNVTLSAFCLGLYKKGRTITEVSSRWDNTHWLWRFNAPIYLSNI